MKRLLLISALVLSSIGCQQVVGNSEQEDQPSIVKNDTLTQNKIDTIVSIDTLYNIDTVVNVIKDTVFYNRVDTIVRNNNDTIFSSRIDTVTNLIKDTLVKIDTIISQQYIYNTTKDTVVFKDTIFSNGTIEMPKITYKQFGEEIVKAYLTPFGYVADTIVMRIEQSDFINNRITGTNLSLNTNTDILCPAGWDIFRDISKTKAIVDSSFSHLFAQPTYMLVNGQNGYVRSKQFIRDGVYTGYNTISYTKLDGPTTYTYVTIRCVEVK